MTSKVTILFSFVFILCLITKYFSSLAQSSMTFSLFGSHNILIFVVLRDQQQSKYCNSVVYFSNEGKGWVIQKNKSLNANIR